MQRCSLNGKVGNTLTAAHVLILHRDLCSHLCKHIQNAGARRIDANISEQQATSLNDTACNKEIRCRTDIPRHCDHIGGTVVAILHGEDSNARSRALDMYAEARKHLLCMVARHVRFRDGGWCIRI